MNILIDARIRDWVLFPILISMFMVAILRYYLTKYMGASKTKDKPSKSALKEMKNKNVSLMCKKIMEGSSLLPEHSFKMRRAFLCKKNTGYLPQLISSSAPTQNALGLPGGNMPMNPGAMTDMIKNNLTMIVSSMGMFAWISYLFSGFILAKVPFPLTQKFKVMLQRGVEITNLDVKYVSSTSFYFLILFGQSGLINLFLGSNEDEEDLVKMDDMQAMGQPMQMGMMPGQGQDFSKILNSERENIELIRHKYALADYEDALINKWKGAN